LKKIGRKLVGESPQEQMALEKKRFKAKQERRTKHKTIKNE